MINKITLMGYVGKELNYSIAGGYSVADFSLALNNEKIYNKTTQTNETKTLWLKVKFIGKTVDNYIKPYLKMGDLIYIEGKLNVVEWKDNFGQNRKSYSILGEKINIIPNKVSTSNNIENNSNITKSEITKSEIEATPVKTATKKPKKFSSVYNKEEDTSTQLQAPPQEIIIPQELVIPNENKISYGYSNEEDDIPF